MRGKNEHAENFLLFVIVGGLVVAGVLYVLFLFWPYLVFYILPFLIGSLVVGGILRLSATPGAEKSEIVHHRSLLATFSGLIFLVVVVFFAGSKRAAIVDKKGNLTGKVYLDWPKANQAFNEHRSGVYKDSPFEGLKAKAQEGVVYDRQEMGWIALWCLFLGGPLFFWWWSRGDEEKVSEIIEAIADARTKTKREILENRTEKLDAIIESHTSQLKAKISDLERNRTAIVAENQILKAKLEFSPDIPKPPGAQKSNGVLDRDIL